MEGKGALSTSSLNNATNVSTIQADFKESSKKKSGCRDTSSSGANVATDADLFQKAMFAAAQILDEKDVPSMARYAFVSPVTYYTAAQEPKLLNKDWDGSGSLSKGTFETLAGITVVKTNHLPKTDISGDATVPAKYRGNFSKTAFQIFHETAVGTVKLMDLAMESEYLIRNQATFMVAKYAVGHGILRPESAIEVASV